MKLLLDTHIWLWLIQEASRLPRSYDAALTNSANLLFLSVASVWEVGIKQQLGKLSLGTSFEEFLLESLAGVQLVDITLSHVKKVNQLPLHHRDPFDRIIVAQAMIEGLTLMSVDPMMAPYEATILPSRA